MRQEEISSKKAELASALKSKDQGRIARLFDELVAAGDTESEREYAKVLEAGVLLPRSPERAEELYRRAAIKNDAQSALAYSRYVAKKNIDLGIFWKMYAAALGESTAYVPTAEELSRVGKEREANHFLELASYCDHKDATYTLAQRYRDGIGFDFPNHSYAKWYLKKYVIPSPYVIPMLIKMRKTKAKEPPRVEFDAVAFLKNLVRMSLDAGCDSATLNLCRMLGEKGDIDALASCGLMKVRSIGTSGETDEGMKILRECAVRGSADAYFTLGETYLDGKCVSKDVDAAVFNFEKAAALGHREACETLGDVFTLGKETEPDFVRGLEYYEKAKKLGSRKGERRAAEIKSERERLYSRANDAKSDEERFRFFAIACAMGHPVATTRLAQCYENGIGTKRDTVAAFTWYKEAVARSDNGAYMHLGRCYKDGVGVNRDFSKAAEILKTAIRLGDSRADRLLKDIYETKKRKIAASIYSRAMRLLHTGRASLSAEMLALADELQYPKAIYSLGCLYEFGMGVPVNKDKAYAMYEVAYRSGFRDPRAKFKLSILRKARAVKK